MIRHPEARGTLTGYDFDICCGGARTLTDDTARLGLDGEEILERSGAC